MLTCVDSLRTSLSGQLGGTQGNSAGSRGLDLSRTKKNETHAPDLFGLNLARRAVGLQRITELVQTRVQQQGGTHILGSKV